MSEVQIRPIDPRTDIHTVPDLILNCFRPWLDADSRKYIDSMREDASWQRSHPLLYRLRGDLYPMRGYVAVAENGQTVGNLSIYDGEPGDIRCLQFANICVDPSFRGRGIGHQLVRYALDRCAGTDIHLRVREQTPDAVRLYRDCGFEIIGRQTDWVFPAGKTPLPFDSEIVIPPRDERDRFYCSLELTFPPQTRMYLPLSSEYFRFGILGSLRNRFGNANLEFRAVRLNGKTTAYFAVVNKDSALNALCFIPTPDAVEEALTDALSCIAAAYVSRKGLLCESVLSTPAFMCAGFIFHQSLLMMKISGMRH